MTDETELTPLVTAEPQSSREDDEEISLWRKINSIIEKRRVNPNQNLFQTAQREVELYLQDEFVQNSCDPCEWWRSSSRY